MTTKLFEKYKTGEYVPYNRYYIETFKPILIPTYIGADEERWCGPDNPFTHKEIIIQEHYSTAIHVNDLTKYDVEYKGNNIVFNIYPDETIQILLDNGSFDYKTKYLEPYQVTVNYKNIKAFH